MSAKGIQTKYTEILSESVVKSIGTGHTMSRVTQTADL